VNKVSGIWKWTVAILVLLNLGLLATMWLKPAAQHGQEGPRMGGGERPNEMIQDKLHFTDAQTKEFDALRERHHDSIMTLQRQGQELRKQYFDMLKHPEASDSSRIDSIGNAIGNNQKQIEFVTYRHFRQVRALCDDKQKAGFDEIIDDVLRVMSRQHHSPKETEQRGPEGDRAGGGQGPPPLQR